MAFQPHGITIKRLHNMLVWVTYRDIFICTSQFISLFYLNIPSFFHILAHSLRLLMHEVGGREGGELIRAQCCSTYIDQSQLFYIAFWHLSLMRHIINNALCYEENMHNSVSRVETDNNLSKVGQCGLQRSCDHVQSDNHHREGVCSVAS